MGEKENIITGYHEAAHAIIVLKWPERLGKLVKFMVRPTSELDHEPRIIIDPDPPRKKVDAKGFSKEELDWIAIMYAAGYAGECIAKGKSVRGSSIPGPMSRCLYDKKCLEAITTSHDQFMKYAEKAYKCLKNEECGLERMAKRIAKAMDNGKVNREVSSDELRELFK